MKTAVKPSQILTVAQVADQLQCSKRTVCDLIHSGRLPAFRYLSRNWRIRKSDLEAFCQPTNAVAR